MSRHRAPWEASVAIREHESQLWEIYHCNQPWVIHWNTGLVVELVTAFWCHVGRHFRYWLERCWLHFLQQHVFHKGDDGKVAQSSLAVQGGFMVCHYFEKTAVFGLIRVGESDPVAARSRHENVFLVGINNDQRPPQEFATSWAIVIVPMRASMILRDIYSRKCQRQV